MREVILGFKSIFSKNIFSRSSIILLLMLIYTTVGFSQNPAKIYISEIMASNATCLTDIDGDYSDWIEIYNPGSNAVALNGLYLSDDPSNLIKWVFPDVSLEANSYLIVFCSGKDRRTGELHTNFKLSGDGEFIILTDRDGVTPIFDLGEHFPEQFTDISYGYIAGRLYYMDQPTPGAANIRGEFLSPPKFSVSHGLFINPFILEIASDSDDIIKYTIDGTEPGPTTGFEYIQPLIIDSTTVLRAVSIHGGNVSKVTTGSFIFPEKVIRQPRNPAGYPQTWGTFSAVNGLAPADYEMDPEICFSPEYIDLIIPALTSIPSISVVTDKNNFFSLDTDPDTGGIYIHTNPPTGGLGEDWERSISLEYMPVNGTAGFTANCGIRIQGGHSRVPEKNPKHSLRIVFREEYGPSELHYDLFGDDATGTFNSVVLRAGFNKSWAHWDSGQREKAQFIHDSWAKDVFMKMDHTAAHNNFVHLYINGLYWGLYNLSERPDDDFAESYFGGDKKDFDVIKDYAEVAEGNIDAWNSMMKIAENGLSDTEGYYRIQGKNISGEQDETIEPYLDVENLIDYMILNFYMGNKDWDHHNWAAVRNRTDPGKGFQFMPWDSENIFGGKSDNEVNENNENRPSYLYTRLRENPLFRADFAKRANELLSPDGLLGPESAKEMWQKRAAEIDLAIIAETARWGDYRRDVHPYNSEPYQLYTKNDFWLKEQKRLYEEYFPARSQIVLDQLKEIGLAGDIITFVSDTKELSHSNIHLCYPNPFDNQLTFEFQQNIPGKLEIKVFSLEGKLVSTVFSGVLQVGQDNITWNPKGLHHGFYLYQISTSNNSSVGKIFFTE